MKLSLFFDEYAADGNKQPSLPSFTASVDPPVDNPTPPTVSLPSSGKWDLFPTIPLFPQSLPLLCTLTASGVHVVVFGGWDPETLTCFNFIYVYNFLYATRSHGRPMPCPTRSFFACAANPRNQGRFEWSAEAFDVGEWRWLPVEEEAVPEGACSKTCVVGGDGRIYVCDGGGKMMMVKETDEWRVVAELSEHVKVAPKMVAWGEGLMVMGMGGSGWPLAAYVLEMKQGVAIAWRRFVIPKKNSCFFHSACCVDVYNL
ncbi:F-box/kelch-repeat protein At1g80440-like [Dendrobium catenatum]|uniref:F-box/kelch-repeat protein At1g80440-like n=1 Tax=Dendrobium catenatum TaxID=906689 RepID=UPI0010A07CB5|nr:F-box/kelch-repeat protein At1g80440-like [Dendrobium catenatum]